MTPASATMSIPIHLPGSRVRHCLYEPTNDYFTVFRDADKEYHIDPSTEPRLRRYRRHYGEGWPGSLKNVTRKPPRRTYWKHEVKIRDGDSVFLKYKPDILKGFIGTAVKMQCVSIYLLDCDPTHPRVKEAAFKACLTRDRTVCVVMDITPHLKDRIDSFQSDILLKDLFSPEDMSALACEGFYLHNGTIRCSGCYYQKNRKQLLSVMSARASGRLSRIKKTFSSTVSPVRKVVLADHENPRCDNFRSGKGKKTFLTINGEELGHYSLYMHNDLKDLKIPYYPVPPREIYNSANSKKHRNLAKNQAFYPESSSRGMTESIDPTESINLFTTTVPRSEFFTQGDLLALYVIRAAFVTLRTNYRELKDRVTAYTANAKLQMADLAALQEQFQEGAGLEKLMGKDVENCLCDLFAKTFRASYLIACDQSNREGAQRQDVVDACRATLVPLLDKLLALIDQCGGRVASKGFVCLTLDPCQPIPAVYFKYDEPGAVIKGLTGPVNRDELSQIRAQWMVAGIEFTGVISEELLQPLLEIFHPEEFSDDVLRKIFCAPQSLLDLLTASY